MEKRFHLKEHGTTVRTEIMAGITTFMAMAYILMVNAIKVVTPAMISVRTVEPCSFTLKKLLM